MRLAAVLLLGWACACTRSEPGPGRELVETRERRHARRHGPATSVDGRAAPAAPLLHGTVDSGARWRIKVVGSGRYLYKNGADVFGTTQFFSLFELRRTYGGAYLIADSAGKWLHLATPKAEGGAPSLVAVSYAESKLAGPDDEQPMEEEQGAPAPTRFWLKPHEGGANVLRLASDGKSYLCEWAADPRKLVAASSDGSFWKGARVNASALFELQRVVAPLKEREADEVRASASAATGLSFNDKVPPL